MGQAHLVTATALDVYRDARRKVDEGVMAGEITAYWGTQLLGEMIRLFYAMDFAHNRVKVASLALRDVRDVRNIEDTCIRAYISPVTFDLGPEAA